LDRLLAAQALIEGLPLVSRDPIFGEFHVETIW
jgi:PIN domain nuclease of toxin-antitoxin system